MRILRQIWQSIRNDRLFAAIYIFGTALAITTVTVYAISLWIKVAPVYPEYQRSRTAYITSARNASNKGSFLSQSQLSYEAISDVFAHLDNATEASASYDYGNINFVQPEIDRADFKITVKATDPAFFRIYTLDFLAGEPFDDASFSSGLRVAVITDRTARGAFGPVPYESIVGQDISVDHSKYRICGIVREGSPTENKSYGQVFVPYTSITGYDEKAERPFIGNYTMVMLTDNFDALRDEINSIVARYNNSQDDFTISLPDSPKDHYSAALTGYLEDFSIWSFLSSVAGVLLVLLLVPALNLSGMISGHMENRINEMGIRKSFGATRSTLLGSVLAENLVLTLGGGILGYAFAWILLNIGVADVITKLEYGQESVLTAETVFSPAIFAFTFAICCLLNVLSAFIPAYRSLGASIVESLKK